MGNIKKAVIWSFLDKFAVQGITFIIGIFLARLLSPDDYGLIGITSIFIAFSNVFIEAGVSNALIRKLDRTENDLSTAFYLNIGIGFCIYIILYLVAPYIANYFQAAILTQLVRIVGLNIFFQSFCIVQNSLLVAELNIKKQTLIRLYTQIPMGICAIIMAYKGFGVYSLAIQSLGSGILSTILLWINVKWRPRLCFNYNSLKYLWHFGSKMIAANTLGTIFNEIYSIIIGKKIGKSDLGYYTKGRTLAMYPNQVLIGIIQKIAIPVLASYQEDRMQMLERFRYYNKLIIGTICFISSILIVSADSLITILWSDKWIGAIWIFQFVMVINLFSPAATLNLQLLQVVNKTGYVLKLEFIKKPIALFVILCSSLWGIKGLLFGQLLIAFMEYVLNMSASKKYVGYKYIHQIKDFIIYLYPLVISILITSFFISFLKVHIIFEFLVSILISSILFIIILLIRKDEIFYFLIKKYIYDKITTNHC